MQKPTKAQWKKAKGWAQEFLGLHDWELALWYEDIPAWAQTDATAKFGTASWARINKHARIWVDTVYCVACKVDPIQVLFHEILHVAFADLEINMSHEPGEFLLNRLEKAMLAAYKTKVKP